MKYSDLRLPTHQRYVDEVRCDGLRVNIQRPALPGAAKGTLPNGNAHLTAGQATTGPVAFREGIYHEDDSLVDQMGGSFATRHRSNSHDHLLSRRSASWQHP